VSATSWIEAWQTAVRAHWLTGPSKPSEMFGLHLLKRIARDLPYTPPEQMGHPARKAWALYQDEGDTEVGRAAVALTYAIADEQKRVPRG
jgi:hypothetical protein